MDGLIKKGQTDAAKLSQDYCRTELDELLKQGQTIIQNLSHDGPKVRLDEVLNQSRELIEQLTQNDHMVHPVSTQQNLKKEKESLEDMKSQLAVDNEVIKQWVTEVQEWAHTATSGDNDVPVEPLMNTIEEMAVSIKQRRHHLYRHTGNPWNLSEEGIQGLHCMLQRRLDQLTAHRDTLKKSYQMIDNMTTCSTVEDEYVSCLEDHLSSSTDQSSDEDDTSVY
ncbi:hypothetical protein E1301_Tti020362 [Triplophysa tibetana]|uniref:Uncharacterized protein n=1 Tax=Triplophysa tibetana TaxID=1572043 RepID=A0A5A9P4B7_9TELE|nr:hypothetical protein E1301_Tti020362 [Triplophysa tibetana]